MKYLLIFSFLLLATFAAAAEVLPVTPAATEPPGLFEEIGERFYLETTDHLVSLSEDLDSFFPNPDHRRFDYHRTRLLVQAGLQVDSRGKLRVLQRVGGRIVLPRLEDRVSLYFSGASEDLNSRDNPDPAASDFIFLPRVEDTHLRFGFNTALRLIFTENKYYLVQNQLGVRLLPTWDPYNEVSGQLRIPFDKFLWQPGQSLFWRQSTGFGETTRSDLDYALKKDSILRWHEEATTSQESNGFEHRHSLAFLHQLSKRRGYVVAMEARGETSPIQRMTQYVVGFTWKELIHKDWLYVETGINALFAHEEHFEPIPAIFFSLITDFNGKKNKKNASRSRDVSPSP
jgi:hypothetical protein